MASNIFELQRKRAQQQATAAEQAGSEALKRKFASMGALRSGAAIKQEQVLREEVGKQLGQQIEGINAQEMEKQAQQEEVEKGRQFAAGQAELQRKFEAGESATGREYQKQLMKEQQLYGATEAEKQRVYSTGERAAAEAYATTERTSAQEFAKTMAIDDRAFKQGIQDWNASQAALEYQLAKQQFDMDKEAQFYNINLSKAMAMGQGINLDFLVTGTLPPPPPSVDWNSYFGGRNPYTGFGV